MIFRFFLFKEKKNHHNDNGLFYRSAIEEITEQNKDKNIVASTSVAQLWSSTQKVQTNYLCHQHRSISLRFFFFLSLFFEPSFFLYFIFILFLYSSIAEL